MRTYFLEATMTSPSQKLALIVMGHPPFCFVPYPAYKYRKPFIEMKLIRTGRLPE